MELFALITLSLGFGAITLYALRNTNINVPTINKSPIKAEVSNPPKTYPLDQDVIFCERSAQAVFHHFSEISLSTAKKLELLNNQIKMCGGHTTAYSQLNEQITRTLEEWSDRIRSLGGLPVSLYKVRLKGEDKDFLWSNTTNQSPDKKVRRTHLTLVK